MKAFITGISGFVGTGLARHLIKEGVEVHGMVRSSSNLWRLEDIKDKLYLHEGDLLDAVSVAAVIEKVTPDTIFHLAVHGAYSSQKDADKILSTTILSTLHLLNSAKKVGVKMFVNAGSSSEYGTKDHPMREDERIDPNSYYAVGKAAQTHLCQYFSKTEGLPVVTLRLFSVYGPYEEPGRLVPTVILNALSGKEIMISDPKVARDFIYLDDVAHAFFLAAQDPKLAGEVLNLGTGVQHTLGDIVDTVICETKTSSKYSVGGDEKRSFDTYTWVADTTKLTALLRFSPRYTLMQGISEVFHGSNNMQKNIKNKKNKKISSTKKLSMKAIGEEVRRLVVDMSEKSHSGETGSSLSISDILAVLYFKIMNIDPKKPNDSSRDRFILSKGHGAAAYYATLALRGYFPLKKLLGHRVEGGDFHGHPSRGAAPGIEVSTGSLGHGLSIAAGMAYAIKNTKSRVYVLIGDGECNEGSIWEAALYIGNAGLANIIAIIDDNKFQGFSATKETNRFNLGKQWQAFGWKVLRANGHDPKDLEVKLKLAASHKLPTVVIADTISGKGLPHIEHTLRAHYHIPSKADVQLLAKKKRS